MKKILLLLISIFVVGAYTLQSSVSHDNVIIENAKAIQRDHPTKPCFEWISVICQVKLNHKCSWMIPEGTCEITNHRRHELGNPID